MEEDLPNEFDVIVLGTGMPESILAAAAARSGKSVLHLDQNDYYGADWGSFNFDNLQEWAKNAGTINDVSEGFDDTFTHHVREGETLLIMPPKSHTSFNVQVDELVAQFVKCDKSKEIQDTDEKPCDPLSTDNHEQGVGNPCDDGDSKKTVNNTEEKSTNSSHKMDDKTISQKGGKSEEIIWTIDGFHKQRRKFNLDLSPKLLFSRGALVELLIQSNISRYAEFKCSSQILTLIDGNLMPVPCSRADVFSTKHVSIVEKRMLMKLLKFCLDFEEHPEEYKDYENKPFVKFLNSKKLTRNVEHYLIHSIAMVDPNHPTLDSLKRVQKFLQSLGRYGNSPFLFPLYGSGEMPQCFCRLCAVFGGVYCLKRKVDALICNEKNECVAAVVNNKRIHFKFLAMECGYSPKNYLPTRFTERSSSKAIVIADSPLHPSEHDQLTFLRLPVSESFDNAIDVLELGPSSNVCPQGLRLVYMSCHSKKHNSKDDLQPAVHALLNVTKPGDPKLDVPLEKAKPNALWVLYFNQYDNSWLDLNERAPGNVFLLPTPDIDQDYENAIGKAKEAFVKMFPKEEFLPRAPEPEEIIMESDEAEKNTENSDKINCLESEQSSHEPSNVENSEETPDKKNNSLEAEASCPESQSMANTEKKEASKEGSDSLNT